MKRLAFLGFTIATLMAPIQVQAQQNCITFPQPPNPEAELRYLLANPGTRVCPSANPNPAEQGSMDQISRNRNYNNYNFDRGSTPSPPPDPGRGRE
jgi:hypothetical protein